MKAEASVNVLQFYLTVGQSFKHASLNVLLCFVICLYKIACPPKLSGISIHLLTRLILDINSEFDDSTFSPRADFQKDIERGVGCIPRWHGFHNILTQIVGVCSIKKIIYHEWLATVLRNSKNHKTT